MAKEAKIIITADDQASDKLKKVGNESKSFSDKVKANLGKIRVASGLVVAGIVAMGKNFIDEANTQIRVNTQLETVLKSTGNAVGMTSKQIQDMASGMQKMNGIADDVIQTGQNMLLTFTNIGKETFPNATQTMLDMATAMNGGVKPSAEQLKGTAIQLGKALNDPIQGISALSRVGVSFTDKQKAVIESLVKTGKTAEAQKIILAELNREFGGSASANMKTFEGRMQALQLTIGDAKEAIGMALIPAVEKLTSKLVPIINKVSEWIQANPELASNIMLVVGGVAALVLGLSVLLPAISAIGVALGVLAGPVGIIIAGVGALAFGLYKLNEAMYPPVPTAEELTQALSEVDAEIIQLNKDYGAGKVGPEEYRKKIAELTKQQDALNLSLKATRATAEQVNAVMAGLAKNQIGTSFGGLANLTPQKAQALMNTKVPASNINAYSTPALPTAKKVNFGSFSTPIGGFRADGGPVQAGKKYVVGEEGPEYFIPGKNGMIDPNKGGQNISVNLGGVTINNGMDANNLATKIANEIKRLTQLYNVGIA